MMAVLVLLLLVGLAVIAIGPTTLKRWAYEEPGRDGWQQPERVIEALAVDAGSVVGDLGAGGGYFAFRLAEAVGSEGRVWAVDVDEGLLAYVEEEAAARSLPQLRVALAAADDPRFPEPLDLLFTSNTVHHFDDPGAYFGNARRYLRPGGRLAIVDYRGGRHHGLPADELVAALESVGYRLEERHEFLERQDFLVFRVEGGPA